MRRQKTRLLAPGNMEEVILIAFYLVSLPGWRYISSFKFQVYSNKKRKNRASADSWSRNFSIEEEDGRRKPPFGRPQKQLTRLSSSEGAHFLAKLNWELPPFISPFLSLSYLVP